MSLADLLKKLIIMLYNRVYNDAEFSKRASARVTRRWWLVSKMYIRRSARGVCACYLDWRAMTTIVGKALHTIWSRNDQPSPSNMSNSPYDYDTPFFDEDDYPNIDERTCRLLGPTALVSSTECRVENVLTEDVFTDRARPYGHNCDIFPRLQAT